MDLLCWPQTLVICQTFKSTLLTFLKIFSSIIIFQQLFSFFKWQVYTLGNIWVLIKIKGKTKVLKSDLLDVKKKLTINAGEWAMCNHKCVKFNQSLHLQENLWKFSFNCFILRIIFYARLFYHSQIESTIDLTRTAFFFLKFYYLPWRLVTF